MNTNASSDLLIGQQPNVQNQFDYMPFPGVAIESPALHSSLLFPYSITTSHYFLKQKVVEPKDRIILDAGCGTGYKSLALSCANPDAQIVAIDFSQQSIEVAKERLKFHNCDNVELLQMRIEDVGELGYKFDYINCEDVLYLLDDPLKSLVVLQSVLRNEGTMRLNFHSKAGRESMLRAQEALRMLGLMDENPKTGEIEIVRKLMRSLRSDTNLKRSTWNPSYEREESSAAILANHLLLHDRGCTVKEFFDMLRGAELDFLNMVNWPAWELRNLFNGQSIPDEIYKLLEKLSIEGQLHWFELIQPRQRLLDLWCCKPQKEIWKPLSEWDYEWEHALIHLHPIFQKPDFQELCLQVIKEHKTMMLQVFHSLPEPRYIDPILASVMLRLFDGPKTLDQLLADGIDGFLAQHSEIGDPKLWLRQIVESMAELLYFLVEEGEKLGSTTA